MPWGIVSGNSGLSGKVGRYVDLTRSGFPINCIVAPVVLSPAAMRGQLE